MQETYKNVRRSDKRIAFSKLSYVVFEEKHIMTNMISVIRINILYLQTGLINKKPGPASQYRMQVSNMCTINFVFCPWRANAGRFKNISCISNEPKPHGHMTNYKGVKLDQERSRLRAESKILYRMVWLKLFFFRCFCRKTVKPQRSYGLNRFLRYLKPPKKTLAKMKQKAKQGMAKTR